MTVLRTAGEMRSTLLAAAGVKRPHAAVLQVWGNLTAQSAGGMHPVDRNATIGRCSVASTHWIPGTAPHKIRDAAALTPVISELLRQEPAPACVRVRAPEIARPKSGLGLARARGLRVTFAPPDDRT